MAGLILGSIETGRFRYTMLTTDEIVDLDLTLDKGRFIISHVGDGEYTCNIFGNVFSNYTKALESYTKYLDDSTVKNYLEAIIKEEFLSWDKEENEYSFTDYYVGKIFTKADGKHHVSKEGRLTIARLNGKFIGGY